MSVEAVQERLSWSSEAIERCAVLSTDAGRPSHMRQLFHAPLPGQPANSCLLHQMTRLLTTGLAAASDACSKASDMPYGLASTGTATRAAIAKAASAVRTHAPACPFVVLSRGKLIWQGAIEPSGLFCLVLLMVKS